MAERGGAGGIALTHDHPDHAEGLPALRARLGDPPVGRMPPLADGDAFGPFTAFHVPGHAADHLVFVADGVAFTGDAVLGAGSVFIAPGGGWLGPTSTGCGGCARSGWSGSCPATARRSTTRTRSSTSTSRTGSSASAGSSPRSTPALRDEDELLAAAWDSVPDGLRLPARWTLQAHLEKLRAEGRLP